MKVTLVHVHQFAHNIRNLTKLKALLRLEAKMYKLVLYVVAKSDLKVSPRILAQIKNNNSLVVYFVFIAIINKKMTNNWSLPNFKSNPLFKFLFQFRTPRIIK